jgi:hypothetical protein
MRAGELPLFDDIERTDPRLSRYSESLFGFLNRVDRPMFAAVQALMQEWFSRFPEDARVDLRQRLRSTDRRQSVAAFWELYLHELHLRLGLTLERDPDVPGTRRHPDFRVHLPDGGFYYLEATVVSDGDEDVARDRREALLMDTIDEAFNPDFFVMLDVLAVGPTTAPRSDVVPPIERFLAGLDWPTARAKLETGTWEPPVCELRPAGGLIRMRAYPKAEKSRGDPNFRTIGAEPPRGGMIDDREPILRKLRSKARRYEHPDGPFVIAILCQRTFVEDMDIEWALYGPEVIRVPVSSTGPGHDAYADRDPDGLWQRGSVSRATRVSAVLSGIRLMPWSVARTPLRLWLNPWAARPLDVDLPFERVIANVKENRLQVMSASKAPHEMLGISEDWPGEGLPFDD